MSHFTMIVATKDNPNITEDDVEPSFKNTLRLKENKENALEKALQPFHEYESTNVKDEYVKNSDVTKEYEKDYQTDTIPVYKNKDGALFYQYDKKNIDIFYRLATYDEEYNSNIEKDYFNEVAYIFVQPLGYEKVKVLSKDFWSFKEYLENWHNIFPEKENENNYTYYTKQNDGTITVYTNTNPNAKWDYWLIIDKRMYNREGNPVISIQKKNLDIEKTRSQLVKNILSRYDDCVDSALKSLNSGSDDYHYGVSDLMVAHQKAVKLYKNSGITKFNEFYEKYKDDKNVCIMRDSRYWFRVSAPFGPIDDFTIMNHREHIKNNTPLLISFGILLDGKWHERGNMGWWGIVSDEKENWQEEFDKIFKSIPDDYWLTYVDCHI